MKLHLPRLAAGLAALALTAPAVAHAEGGNQAVNSIGTVQVGAVTVDPQVTVADTPVADEISVAGNTQVGGEGGNSASNSVGTAQVGGGNRADDSLATVQASNVKANPKVTVKRSPLARRATVSGNTRIGGGGNTADGSLGTVQVSNVEVDPHVSIERSLVTKNAGVRGGTRVGGGGNTAGESIGTVQLGGGNRATRSALTAQAGSITVDPVATIGRTAASDGTVVDGATSIGGGGNSATDSAGSVQVGGGNTASDSIGTVQVGGTTPAPHTPPRTTPTPETPPTITPSAPFTPPLAPPTAAVPQPQPSATPKKPMQSVKGRGATVTRPRTTAKPADASRGVAGIATIGQAKTLPFTGSGLWQWAFVGLLLMAAGFALRRRAERVGCAT